MCTAVFERLHCGDYSNRLPVHLFSIVFLMYGVTALRFSSLKHWGDVRVRTSVDEFSLNSALTIDMSSLFSKLSRSFFDKESAGVKNSFAFGIVMKSFEASFCQSLV